MRYVIRSIMIPFGAKEGLLQRKIAKITHQNPTDFSFEILKKSIDARHDEMCYVYSVLVETKSPLSVDPPRLVTYKEPEPVIITKVDLPSPPVVIGFGPSGIFASLALARAGAKPIILERGQPVERRVLDVESFFDGNPLNPESNLAYGEGGAGTFSDGKLTTGVKDAHMSFVLKEFVKHGAPSSILVDGKPHIGTDYLRKVVRSFREEIISLGGEIRFGCHFERLDIYGNAIKGLWYMDANHDERHLDCENIFLAIGSGPQETYRSLLYSGVMMQARDFAIGIRIEHRQKDVDRANYHGYEKRYALPPSTYKGAVLLSSGRSVFTFCMCPGGQVVGSSALSKHIVTNGMSENARSAPNANSALLVPVRVQDFHGESDPLSGFLFREEIERKAFLADKPYYAPCMRLDGFLKNEMNGLSSHLRPSFRPGVYEADFTQILPSFVVSSLQEGIVKLQGKLPFLHDEEALLYAPETHSSSPVRLQRDEWGMSNIQGLYPLGEGPSYAGGIMSAALDGLAVSLGFLGRHANQ